MNDVFLEKNGDMVKTRRIHIMGINGFMSVDWTWFASLLNFVNFFILCLILINKKYKLWVNPMMQNTSGQWMFTL